MMMHQQNIIQQFDLKEYNTMGVSSIAEEAFILKKINDVERAFDSSLRSFVLGGGSNILLPERMHRRVVVNKLKQIEIIDDNADHVYLKIGGGENWHSLVEWTVNQGWAGLENLALIPGTCGAAPIQNIGAYGVELKDVFVSLEAFEIHNGKIISFSKDECQFGYRDSIFKHHWKNKLLITSIVLKLSKEADEARHQSYRSLRDYLEENKIENPSINHVFDAVVTIRQSKLPDPDQIGNTGSFFKNAMIGKDKLDSLLRTFPDMVYYNIDDEKVKVPTGWLIEKCGWKGKSIGEAGVYEKQALVLVNRGNATSSDIKNLASVIIKDVDNKFGITISPEVNYIGSH